MNRRAISKRPFSRTHYPCSFRSSLGKDALPTRFAMTTVVATTTAAITTVTAAAAAEAATSAATATIFARFSFVDFQGATTQLFAIELINSRRGLFLGGHFDEGEPT